jgi:RimJ/RimL family protein N-acetyltransferase
VFRHDKVTLAPFTWEQAQQYLSWVNDEEVATRLTRCLPVSPLEHQKWYEDLVRRQDAVVFSVLSNEDGSYLGNVWLWNMQTVHRNAELRIVLGPQSPKGRGYGSAACSALLEFAFQHLNLHKVYLYVLVRNASAVRTFEKAGFASEGKLAGEFFVAGAYRDALRMAAWRPS